MDDANRMIAVVVLALVFIVWVGYSYNKRRAEAFLAFARSRGYSFSKGGLIDPEKSFGNFRLFSSGYEKKVSNLMSGETDGVNVLIFDYSYKYDRKTGEEGQSSQGESLTVLILQSDILELPSFQVYPKSVLNYIFNGMEKQVVDIHENIDFTASYMLKADNEVDIKKIFSDEAFSYLGSHKGLTIEGKGSKLILHRYTLLKPDELRSFLDEGLELFRMLR